MKRKMKVIGTRQLHAFATGERRPPARHGGVANRGGARKIKINVVNICRIKANQLTEVAYAWPSSPGWLLLPGPQRRKRILQSEFGLARRQSFDDQSLAARNLPTIVGGGFVNQLFG